MKIRMKTTRSGPDADSNWTEGQVRTVSVEEARALVGDKLADALEDFPAEVEIVAKSKAQSKGESSAEWGKPK